MNPLTTEQQPLMALAAVFEAAAKADRIAHEGDVSDAAMEELFGGVLVLEAYSFADIYPHPERFVDGLRLLRLNLSRNQSRDTVRPLTYAAGLLHLAGQLRRKPDMVHLMHQRLVALEGQRAHFDSLAGTAFCHRLAGVYLDTLGTLRFRIRVQGNPEILRNDDNAARIRAVFLGGVRAAFLWHHHGGRRWQLLFQRKRLYDILSTIKIN